MEAELILGIIWLVILIACVGSLITFVIGSIIRRIKYNKIVAHGRNLLKDYYADHPEKVGDEDYLKYKNL